MSRAAQTRQSQVPVRLFARVCVSAHIHVHPRKRLPRAESRADTLRVALPYSSSRRQDSSGISKRRRRRRRRRLAATSLSLLPLWLSHFLFQGERLTCGRNVLVDSRLTTISGDSFFGDSRQDQEKKIGTLENIKRLKERKGSTAVDISKGIFSGRDNRGKDLSQLMRENFSFWGADTEIVV